MDSGGRGAVRLEHDGHSDGYASLFLPSDALITTECRPTVERNEDRKGVRIMVATRTRQGHGTPRSVTVEQGIDTQVQLRELIEGHDAREIQERQRLRARAVELERLAHHLTAFAAAMMAVEELTEYAEYGGVI